MDDFILIHHDKEYLKDILKNIENELNKVYKLNINSKKTKITNNIEGFNFCGYRFRVINKKTVINVSSSTRKRVKKRIKEVSYLYRNNKISFNTAFSSINTYYYGFKFGSISRMRRLVNKYFFSKF